MRTGREISGNFLRPFRLHILCVIISEVNLISSFMGQTKLSCCYRLFVFSFSTWTDIFFLQIVRVSRCLCFGSCMAEGNIKAKRRAKYKVNNLRKFSFFLFFSTKISFLHAALCA